METNSIDSVAIGPLRELSGRLKYYPIVQVATRLYPSLYQFAHGFKSTSFLSPAPAPKMVALCFYGLLVPAAGIGYLIVFLIMQPLAYQHLKQRLSLCLCCCRPSFATNNVNSDTSVSSMFQRYASTLRVPLNNGGANSSNQATTELPSLPLAKDAFTRSVDSMSSMFSEHGFPDELRSSNFRDMDEDQLNRLLSSDISNSVGNYY